MEFHSVPDRSAFTEFEQAALACFKRYQGAKHLRAIGGCVDSLNRLAPKGRKRLKIKRSAL
jgi:hypothetical protein